MFSSAFADVLGLHGIFVADGEPWKKQRKMASHIFSVGNFRTHVQSTIQGDLETMRTLFNRSADMGVAVDLPGECGDQEWSRERHRALMKRVDLVPQMSSSASPFRPLVPSHSAPSWSACRE